MNEKAFYIKKFEALKIFLLLKFFMLKVSMLEFFQTVF